MNELISLRDIEIRIEEHMRCGVQHMIQVGKYLNEVKDRKMVPHGEWEAWASAHTGMNKRMYQEWMRVAREVDEGSVLSTLEISKISAILALPEPEREPMAKRASEESLTVKQLRTEIARMKNTESEIRQNCDAELERMRARVQTTLAQNGQIDRLRREAEHEAERLRTALEEEQSREPIVMQDPEQAETIRRLREDLAIAEAAAERQAELAARARADMVNQSFGHDDVHTHVEDVIQSIREFLGNASVLMHMQRELSDGMRGELTQWIHAVAKWAEDADRAVNAYVIAQYTEIGGGEHARAFDRADRRRKA